VLWDLEPLDDAAGQKLVRDLEAKAQDEVACVGECEGGGESVCKRV